MKKQIFNPFLPSFEYVPDGEPYVFGDRVYIYGSHDKFNGDVFCQNDYVCWSANIHDLTDWKYEGVIYKKTQDPYNPNGDKYLYAPDITQGLDGRYYLYYALDMLGVMSVAVCDTPAGEFEYYGTVKYADGKVVGEDKGDIFQFDPGIFIDEDNRIYLYTGFGPGDSEQCEELFQHRRYEGTYCIELESDMITVKSGPTIMLPKIGYADETNFKGHEFFEASSMRKIENTYYFIYSSINSHELCYATSKYPNKEFQYGGTIISNGDIYLEGRTKEQALNYFGNNHGSIIEIDGSWYVFYHRQTNQHSYSRQACAEKIQILEDGSIPQVEMTSCGLNDGLLQGNGVYGAYIACNLYSKNGTFHFDDTKKNDYKSHPYFTQSGVDREDNGDQYIANMQDGSVAGFKYFNLEDTKEIAISVRGTGKGIMRVYSQLDGQLLTNIKVETKNDYLDFSNEVIFNSNCSGLYFKFEGVGHIDFESFELK